MSVESVEVVPMLPAPWVARIFSKLTVRYGAGFRQKFAGVDEALLRDDWAEQLAAFRNRPDCISYALNNLPLEKAPGVGEFRALCNAAPEPNVPRLEHKSAPIPAAVATELAKIKVPVSQSAMDGPKGWAYRLREREEAGEKLGVCQRRFWRDALGTGAVLSAAEATLDHERTEKLKKASAMLVRGYMNNALVRDE